MSEEKDYFETAQEFVSGRLDEMDKGFAKIKPRLDEDYSFYQSIPIPRRNPNDSNLFVPRTREIVEAIQPRMAGDFLNATKPYVDVVGRGPEDNAKAEAVKNWLFFRMQEMDLPMRLLPYIKQCLIYGTTVGMVAPRNKFRIVRRRPDGIAAKLLYTAKLMNLKGLKERVEALLYQEVREVEGSVFLPLDLYDHRIDPEATSHEDAFDEAHKSKTTIDALKDEQKHGIAYINLDDVKEGSAEEPDKAEREGTQDEDDKPQDGRKTIDRWEWWGPYDMKDSKHGPFKQQLCRIVLCGEERTLVLLEVNPFGNGRSPFVWGRFEFDPFKVYGIGIPRMLRALQKEINELRNLRIDILHRMLSPMLMVKEGALVNAEEAKSWRPFGLIRVRTGEILGQVIAPLFPAQMGSAVASLQEEHKTDLDIQGRSSATDQVRGMQGQGSETATEFSAKLTQAGIIFTYNFKVFAQESLKKIGSLTLEHDQQTMDKARMTRIIGPENAAIFNETSPEEIQGQYDYFPTVDPAQMRRGEILNKLVRSIPVLQGLAPMIGMEGAKVSWKPIAEGFVDNLGLPGGPFIVPFTPQELAMQQFQQMMASVLPGGPGGGNGKGGPPKQPGDVPDNAAINQTKGLANQEAMGEGVV